MVGTLRSSSRLTTTSNADPAVCSSGAPLARSPIDPQFRDPFAERFRVRGIALAKPIDGNGYPGRGLMIQTIEPSPERTDILLGEEFFDPDHMVSLMLLYASAFPAGAI